MFGDGGLRLQGRSRQELHWNKIRIRASLVKSSDEAEFLIRNFQFTSSRQSIIN